MTSSTHACDKPGCKLTSLHDHVDAVITREPAREPVQAKQEARVPEAKPEPETKPGLMGLLGDALDELAGVSESFTGKPSSLRETAKKTRVMQRAADKTAKLGQAIQESKLPVIGKKIIKVVRDNVKLREYYK